MAVKQGGEPRAHHFVPQCWLSGFTDTGQKDGQLWVTDIVRTKQWPTNPAKAGHQRDFYRVSDPQLDPVVVEKAFSIIENAIAPVLRAIDEERREPTEDEMEGLVTFMAFQWVRVPAFRPTVLAIVDSITRSQLSRALKSRDSWAAALKEAGIPSGSPGADYDGMREFERSGQYSLSAETEWYLQQAFAATETIIPFLRERHWRMSFSNSGSFIGSDNPVALDGPKGQKVGFRNAEIVIYPVSRHALLYGTNVVVRPPFVNRKYIAHTNTFTMLRTEAQIYSHVSDFCWMDETYEYRTDWSLFSKEKFERRLVE
jgi:hypothetical protein